jgi:ATP phosphoribosyltransferase regulatory subunit HisZ
MASLAFSNKHLKASVKGLSLEKNSTSLSSVFSKLNNSFHFFGMNRFETAMMQWYFL